MSDIAMLPQMRLPTQSAPVARGSGPAAVSGGGLDASGWFDDIVDTVAPFAKQAAQTAAPYLLSMI